MEGRITFEVSLFWLHWVKLKTDSSATRQCIRLAPGSDTVCLSYRHHLAHRYKLLGHCAKKLQHTSLLRRSNMNWCVKQSQFCLNLIINQKSWSQHSWHYTLWEIPPPLIYHRVQNQYSTIITRWGKAVMKCKNTNFLQLLLRQCQVQGEASLSRRYQLPLTCIIWGFGMKSPASRQSVHGTERGG